MKKTLKNFWGELIEDIFCLWVPVLMTFLFSVFIIDYWPNYGLLKIACVFLLFSLICILIVRKKRKRKD